MFPHRTIIVFLIFVTCSFSEKIAVIGSGSWGTAIAYKLGSLHPDAEIAMWTFEETTNDGRKLTDVINEDHINSKYLPNIKLASTIRASSSLESVCLNASTIVFVVPHQFLCSTLRLMLPYVNPHATSVSCIKGMTLSHSRLELLSDVIQRELKLQTPCAVLMGANVATDVASDHFVEATVACKSLDVAQRVRDLFNCDTFQIECVEDVFTVEVCGALKNVVAMGAGFCDGMDVGPSTKAAIMRKGLLEIAKFCTLFHPNRLLGVDPYVTVMESCGLGDVVASSIGGRNRACAAEFARRSQNKVIGSDESHAAWADIEGSLLRGQKLQGLSTCDEAIKCLLGRNALDRFPLLKRIHGISREGWAPSRLLSDWTK